MDNKQLALIYKGLSHILANQEKIMRKLNIGDPYINEDTNELAVQFGKLSEAYFRQYQHQHQHK